VVKHNGFQKKSSTGTGNFHLRLMFELLLRALFIVFQAVQAHFSLSIITNALRSPKSTAKAMLDVAIIEVWPQNTIEALCVACYTKQPYIHTVSYAFINSLVTKGEVVDDRGGALA